MNSSHLWWSRCCGFSTTVTVAIFGQIWLNVIPGFMQCAMVVTEMQQPTSFLKQIFKKFGQMVNVDHTHLSAKGVT